MVNKKGQEMSVTTLVLIVIGVVLLVMLILGFSMGWSNLWGKINILGGGSNLETVIEACKIAAISDTSYSYCNEFRLVTLAGEKQYVNCDFPAVRSVLDKTLTCPTDVVSKYCGGLRGTKTGDDLRKAEGMKVNGNACGPAPATSTSNTSNTSK